ILLIVLYIKDIIFIFLKILLNKLRPVKTGLFIYSLFISYSKFRLVYVKILIEVDHMIIIKADKITKTYSIKKNINIILKNITFSIKKNEFVFVVGPSGSGKSTLLYVLSGIEDYSSGSILLFDKELNTYSDKEMSIIRQKKIGFVFQSYNLIPNLNVYDNVKLAVILGNNKLDNINKCLEQVKMLEYKDYYPNQLSGGMQQRVAIARALVNDPEIIFADEPTGNLDNKNGIEVMEIFKDLNKKLGKTIIMVTHNVDLIKFGTRVIELFDGKILSDEKLY
ncbi:MAG: ABC transporter ATP-binding protein, partial [Bacilli bacterium]|nr:ABC transporter ATP-binding protein [Bacilli bacterium]